MKDRSSTVELNRLARLYGIQTAYYGMEGRRQADAESLLAVLNAMGAPVASLQDVPGALRERCLEIRRCVLEPVTVAWNGARPVIKVCLPPGMADVALTGHLETEDGRRRQWRWRAADLPARELADIAGMSSLVRQLALPEALPWGYHRFTLEIPGGTAEAMIISAPVKAYQPAERDSRNWGVFAPLYALRSGADWGAGDYTSLASLAGLVGNMGGGTVATLPLLPVFLDEPCSPSPYSPVSCLLWNEFYLDLDNVPEAAACPAARGLVKSLRPEIEKLRALSLVDYRRVMALKRRVLEACCRYLHTENPGRYQDLQLFIRENPAVADYARFRAVMEQQGAPWTFWPQRLRDGVVEKGDYKEAVYLYHAYVQWLAQRQLESLAESARGRGVSLYFDLPVGTHSAGYDTWRERESFVPGVTVGAPPDAVFTGGQNWGFPPLDPERIRRQGYRYFVACIRHHLRYAGMLRLDHVMGLHRLFWIPRGADAGRGVYVRYNAEEFYAILALESHRYRSIIVGEDLGTVPACVRPSMNRHGLQRMYIVNYELACNASCKLHRPPENSVAGLNTHDMPPFAAFWQGRDIPERLRLGLLNEKSARAEVKTRQTVRDALTAFLNGGGWLEGRSGDLRAALRACLLFLGASRARNVLVNLEDLWLETESQNVPSTDGEHPNWRRKARHTLEELCRLPAVCDILEEVDRLRKGRAK